jgi:hypothetical protein
MRGVVEAGLNEAAVGQEALFRRVPFWSLIDRWRVLDEQALELINYEGKLPTTGRRPRFRLSAE